MSAYNIVGKCKVLETNLKSEEITNFYPIFIYFSTFTVISFSKTAMFSFRESYFRLVSPFNWGYARTQFLSVPRNRYSFILVGYRNGKSATDYALIEGFATLAGEPRFLVTLLFSLLFSVFMSFILLLLNSSEPFVFLTFAPGVLLASSGFKIFRLLQPPAQRPRLDLQECYSTLLGWLSNYAFPSSFGKLG